MRRRLRESSRELKRLREQQGVMRRKLRKFETKLKCLEQEVHRGTCDSEEIRRQGVLDQVGEILRDGMRHWINGVLR